MRIFLFKLQSMKDYLGFYKQIAQGYFAHHFTPHHTKYNCILQEEWEVGVTRCIIFGIVLKTFSLLSLFFFFLLWNGFLLSMFVKVFCESGNCPSSNSVGPPICLLSLLTHPMSCVKVFVGTFSDNSRFNQMGTKTCSNFSLANF